MNYTVTFRSAFAAVFLVVGLVFATGCGSTAKATYDVEEANEVRAAGDDAKGELLVPLTLQEAVMCKRLNMDGEQFEPAEVTSSFHFTDEQAVAFAQFKHVVSAEYVAVAEEGHTLRWRWYDPNGELYADSNPLQVQPPGKYHPTASAYHAINIADEKASTLPGTWKVVLLIDDTPLKTVEFEIERSYRPGL